MSNRSQRQRDRSKAVKITVITVARDEERMIPFFLRHYQDWVDEILVYDHQSTDRTRELVEQCPKARWQSYSTGGLLRDDIHALMKSWSYQNKGPFPPIPPVDGNWFINVDCDEFAWHPDMRGYLAGCEADGITLPLVYGYDMISEDGLPPEDGVTKLTDVIKFGTAWGNHSKLAVVHKDCQVNYHAGAHVCSPAGRFKLSTVAEIRIYHYKWLSRAYIHHRYEWAAGLMSPENIQHKWGWHVMERSWVDPEFNRRWSLKEQAIP